MEMLMNMSRVNNPMCLISRGYVFLENGKVFAKVYKHLMTNDYVVKLYLNGKGFSLNQLEYGLHSTHVQYIGQYGVQSKINELLYWEDDVEKAYKEGGKMCRRSPEVFLVTDCTLDMSQFMHLIFRDNCMGFKLL